MQDRHLRAVGRSFHFATSWPNSAAVPYVLGAVFVASIGLGLRAMFLDLDKPEQSSADKMR